MSTHVIAMVLKTVDCIKKDRRTVEVLQKR